MFLRLLALMTLVPILELILILRVHQWVGESWNSTLAWTLTLGTILISGIIGAKLAKIQGFYLLAKAQKSLASGQIPSRTMLEGVLLVIGAVTLITPGYISDLVGFLLLFPVSRSAVARKLGPWLKRQVGKGSIRVHHYQTGSSPHAAEHRRKEEVIDVESWQDESNQRPRP